MANGQMAKWSNEEVAWGGVGLIGTAQIFMGDTEARGVALFRWRLGISRNGCGR